MNYRTLSHSQGASIVEHVDLLQLSVVVINLFQSPSEDNSLSTVYERGYPISVFFSRCCYVTCLQFLLFAISMSSIEPTTSK